MSRRSYPCLLTIYLLRNDVDEEIYAGSTTNLKERMYFHKADAKKACKKGCKLYDHINKLGWEHFYAESLYEFHCEDAEYAGQSEDIAIECFGTLNSYKAACTELENETRRKSWQKEYISRPAVKQKNLERVKLYQSDPKRGGKPITCPCSQNTIKKCSYWSHCRTKRHKQYLELVAV